MNNIYQFFEWAKYEYCNVLTYYYVLMIIPLFYHFKYINFFKLV